MIIIVRLRNLRRRSSHPKKKGIEKTVPGLAQDRLGLAPTREWDAVVGLF